MGRNAFEILLKLPKHGIGAKITRKTWKEGSFWTITDVKHSLDGKHGTVYGRLTWGGQLVNEQPSRLKGPLKKLWRPVKDTSKPQWESFAAAALAKELANESANAAAATSSEQQSPL